MYNALRAALAAVTLGAMLVAPTGARAAANVHTYSLRTHIAELSPGVGSWDGSLQLNVSDDGIVNGYYRPNDGPFVPVTGGVETNGQFWLEIGDAIRGADTYSGTFKDGQIDAYLNRRGNTYQLTTTLKPA
jgi:hypothetical protein